MARLAPKELSLSDSERNELQELINRHKTPKSVLADSPPWMKNLMQKLKILPIYI